MPYRTLVIAPATDLVLVKKEVVAVVNSLRANLLQDIVTAEQVLDKIAEGWDIIWFMTHGSEEGVLLSDGWLSPSALTTFIRTSQARMVVLNTCSSIDVALTIHNELLTHMVCTLADIPDEDAYFMSKQFALQLSRGKTFSQSYLDAKPGQNRSYIFLIGKDSPQPISAVLNPIPIAPSNMSQPHDLADDIKKINEIIEGNPLWGPGLVATVRSLLTEINQLKRAVLILQIGGVVVVVITFLILITVLSLSAG